MLKTIILKSIRRYQKTLSPDEGWLKKFYPQGYCRFTPHCSEYCYLAVEKYGIAKGAGKCGWRILRCNQWSQGGEDKLI